MSLAEPCVRTPVPAGACMNETERFRVFASSTIASTGRGPAGGGRDQGDEQRRLDRKRPGGHDRQVELDAAGLPGGLGEVGEVAAQLPSRRRRAGSPGELPPDQRADRLRPAARSAGAQTHGSRSLTSSVCAMASADLISPSPRGVRTERLSTSTRLHAICIWRAFSLHAGLVGSGALLVDLDAAPRRACRRAGARAASAREQSLKAFRSTGRSRSTRGPRCSRRSRYQSRCSA